MIFKKFSIWIFRSSLFRSYSRKPEKNDIENDQPVKYTTSPAAGFSAKSSIKEDNNRLWYEPEVILVSLSVFLIYFLVLREENDLDEQIYKPLHHTISGLEEVQLKSVIEHSSNKEEIAEAQQRLKEIDSQKSQ